MFIARPDARSRPTTLKPGPDCTNTYDPDLRTTPARSLADACRAAHREARSYFLFEDAVYVAVDDARWLETDLTAEDVVLPGGPAEPAT